MYDVLILGAGPAALTIAAALCDRTASPSVAILAPHAPTHPWGNTYGIWHDELAALDLTHLLRYQWTDTSAFFGPDEIPLKRTYGLLDKTKFQTYLLARCASGNFTSHLGKAHHIEHHTNHSQITTETGTTLNARLVIDATGHHSDWVQRPKQAAIAYQAAYGIVGTFSAPPVRSGQFVLMDYRDEHLSDQERQEPPTFVYAMDFGNNTFFVEETSLSTAPAISFDVLKARLKKRLAHQGIKVTQILEEEHCLFPMTLAMPDLTQPIVAFGGAASMVHPASGYMVGGLLRRAPAMADAIVTALQATNTTPHQVAQQAWKALWPAQRLQKYYIYRFGLEILMGYNNAQLCEFFKTFFALSQPEWAGFLADGLSTPELIAAMLKLFAKAPMKTRLSLMQSILPHGSFLAQAIQSSFRLQTPLTHPIGQQATP
jgi:lycopene beta-cyclase